MYLPSPLTAGTASLVPSGIASIVVCISMTLVERVHDLIPAHHYFFPLSNWMLPGLASWEPHMTATPVAVASGLHHLNLQKTTISSQKGLMDK